MPQRRPVDVFTTRRTTTVFSGMEWLLSLRPKEVAIEVFGQVRSPAHPRLQLEAVVSSPHPSPNAVKVRSAY